MAQTKGDTLVLQGWGLSDWLAISPYKKLKGCEERIEEKLA
jgi:hypothetical protein